MFTRGGRLSSSRWRASIILPIWLLCTFWMWSWWLQPERINFAWLFIPLSLALLYEFAILPTTFLYFVLRAKIPQRRIAPNGKKVAVITLCVPSQESIDIIERQLKAMSEITYPHDSWILDEGNNREVKVLAKKYGVKHFSRKSIQKYNQVGPPFQKKTKAGNVNAWLEHVKHRKYEYFVQLDIDHIPKPNYLNKTLGYFRDKKVAWVQAPSVYKNLSHWTARGAAEQELVLQGPLQMGFYGHGGTPFIIGSHCTYRCSAIREIGGFQPTRAEDHLDTVVLASKGYKGVFLPEIIAEGDGPETLNTYLAQQFAWAYSMFQVLIFHTPKLLKTMPMHIKWQFLFAQTWYPLWGLAYLVMYICPVIALVINQDVASIERSDFLIHFLPMFVCAFFIWWAAQPLMQPRKLFLSWRGMILHTVRWPIILRAVLSVAFKIKKPYMITPKGSFSRLVPTVKLYQPFVVLGLINALAVIVAVFIYRGKALEGQGVFAVTNAIFMTIICLVDLDIRLRKLQPNLKEFVLTWTKPILVTTVLMIITANAFLFSPAVINYITATPKSTTLNATEPSGGSAETMSTSQLIRKIKKIPNSSQLAEPTLGLYNPSNDLPPPSQPYIQHNFANMNDTHTIAVQTFTALNEGNTPLITLEPRGQRDGNKLLSDIVAGVYDPKLQEISSVLGATRQPVYIRFAHEMELYDLYPWGGQDPDLFIAAYRHVVDYLRQHNASNVRWVWSPAGNVGAEAYYPGDDVVDVVGTTILYDQHWYGPYQPTFGELTYSRDWLKTLGKPVWIVEFGAGGADNEFQALLVQQAVNEYKNYGYSAIAYLNIVDSNIQGPNYKLTRASLLRLFAPKKAVSPLTSHKQKQLKQSPSTCQQSRTQLRDLTTTPLIISPHTTTCQLN